ncbi:MAG TPA: FkbM family methyltransferase [Phenylobacterium sp.]|jgi:FkbM family methyltransferase|uniref:FkbM family methyltransferase n=1 Tax=Phenylobacterium sp. TaxID=1871053 RepID=UPI002B66E72C|nr:FkbM family methyltransferase [Phenylobacterium sp.]HXA38380.1 FkbM family methyltransferase [Phenylobacterium sp.]
MTRYRSAILSELSRARFADVDGNYDHELGPEPPPPPGVVRQALTVSRERAREARRLLEEALGALGRALQYSLSPGRYFSKHAAEEIARGQYLYDRLADKRSRALLLKLVAFKVLGHRKVKLPRNTPDYLPTIESMNQFVTDAPPVKIKFMDLALSVFDTKPLGYDMRVHATSTGLAYAIRQMQYEYHNGDVHCKAEAGDVVIDAGGCWGETSMYFAHEVGPSGACVSYEFIPSNIAVFERNLALNPHLASHVFLVRRPIWSRSGHVLHFVDWGPGSRVAADPGGQFRPDGQTETITIDETLEKLGFDRVNFIKMDIEGAELEALKGAEGSIRRRRPKLAISLYHRPEDFTEIPRYIDSLDLGYKFYLEHHTLYGNETVLFAVPSPRALDAAYALRRQGDLAGAESKYDEIITADPGGQDAMTARNDLLRLYEETHRPDDAERIMRAALSVAPSDAKWRYRLATTLLRQGRYIEAWDSYEARADLNGSRDAVRGLPFPEWRGEPVRTLLVWPDGDLGDVIQHSRYLPLLRDRGISVTLACPPALSALLEPLVDRVIPLAADLDAPDQDAWVMIGSLPRAFGTGPDAVPPPALVAGPEGGVGVGVSLEGLEGLPERDRIAITARAEALSGPGAVRLDEVCAGLDAPAIAGKLAELEHVVCPPGALAHLAASLGKPTTVLIPEWNTDWQWGQDREDCAWYPSIKLIRVSAA